MDALPVLTDSVGGVTVTVPMTVWRKVDGRFAEGAQVTLDGGDTGDIRPVPRYICQPERSEPYGAAAGIHPGVRPGRRGGLYS